MFPPAVNSRIDVQKESRILTQASAQAKHTGGLELQGRELLRQKTPGEERLWPAQPGKLAKGIP
jgi:hypothetical protein